MYKKNLLQFHLLYNQQIFPVIILSAIIISTKIKMTYFLFYVIIFLVKNYHYICQRFFIKLQLKKSFFIHLHFLFHTSK